MKTELEGGHWIGIFMFMMETLVSVLKKQSTIAVITSSVTLVFLLFLGFSCPVWYYWRKYWTRNGQATVKEFGTGRMRQYPS